MAYTSSNLCRFLLILAISGLNGEKASGSSDVNSSVEDDAVTITNCYLRDSESHSSSSDNDGTGKQCMSAYIRRQSGNITLNDDRFGDPKGFLMSLEIKSLREVSPCGETIISSGHSYNGFSDQRFHFSEIKDGIYRGIAVKFVSFDMTLNNSASVKVYMYLMDEYGVINNGDEAIAVMPGVAKINVQINNWPFCGQGDIICEQCPYYEIGKFLDMELAVKGTHAATQEKTSENSGLLYSVGRGKILLSQQVQLDGNDTVSSMTNGYPTHNRQNGKDIFHLRFRKFASEVLYDPFIGSNLGGGFGGGIGGLY